MQNYAIRLASSGGGEVRTDFDRVGRTGQEAMDRIGRSARDASTRLREVRGGFSGLSGGQVSNAAFQISDFAVQVGNGTRATTALSQQLPQLLAGFGPVGAIMGALAAIALPLGAAFLSMGDSSGDLSEQQDALADAIKAVDASTRLALSSTAELVALYGEAGQRVRDLIAAKAAMAQDDAASAADNLVSDQLREFLDAGRAPAEAGGYSFGAFAITQELKLALPLAEDLAAAMRDAAAAEGLREQADALARVRDLIDDQRDAYGRLTGPLAEIYGGIVDTEDKLRAAVGATERLDGALSGATGTMAGLASSATAAADEIARAAANAMTLAGQGAAALKESELRLQHKGDPVGLEGALAGERFNQQVGDISGLDPILRDALEEQRDAFVRTAEATARNREELMAWNTAQRAAAGGGGGGRAGGASGGGGKSDLVRQLEREAEARDRVIEGLRRERDMIGESELVQRINNETRAAGVDLGSDYGREIAALVTEIDGLNEVQERTAAVNGFLSDSFASLFKGAITGANSLKESVSQLAMRLSEMALTQGFETLFSGSDAGGGALGSFLGSLFGIGKRAAGGPVAAGVPYLVGERGPELVVPRAAGMVIPNHALAQGQGQPAAPSAIHVTVNGARGNAEIMAMVQAGVTQGLGAYDRGLADRMSSIAEDPRFRG